MRGKKIKQFRKQALQEKKEGLVLVAEHRRDALKQEYKAKNGILGSQKPKFKISRRQKRLKIDLWA